MTLVGTTVGRIRVVDHLGVGGMGKVYVGHDETLKRKVALKAIRDERRLDAEAKARFLREARILSQLDHPNICRIYEYIEEDDSDFLVLELIAGKTLKQALGEDELDPSFKLFIAERVTDALVAAHAQGVAHRDLKPENVMLTPDGGVKVLDFGLAYSVDEGLVTALDGDGSAEDTGNGATDGDGQDDSGEQPLAPTVRWSGPPGTDLSGEAHRPGKPWPVDAQLDPTRPGTARPGPGMVTSTVTPSDFVETRQGIVMGTVAYMSPEQARGERVTVAGDMYSLGLVLQELFTGRLPYEPGLGLMPMLEKAGAGETLPVSGIDPDLEALINRLKSLAPEARPSAIETSEGLRWIRHKPARRLLRRLAAGLLAALLLTGLKYTYDLRRERNRAEAAHREAEQVLEFVVDLFAVSDPQHAGGETITAKDVLDAGAERIAGELGGQPGSQSRLMLTLGRIYRRLGLYPQARPMLEEGLAIRRRLLGDDDPGVAVGLDDLANLYLDQGDYELAEPLFERALEIHQKALGADHPQVAASLNNLAFHYLARGEDERAEPLLLRALEIHQEVLGRGHPVVARSLVNLGDLYRARGEHDRAEPYLRRALEAQEKLLGPDHLELTFSLNNLAMVHYAQGKAELAEPLFQRTLEIQEKVLGPAHPEFATSLNNLAELYRGIGEYERAETLYQQAHEIQEKVLGAAHPGSAVTLSNLADLYSASGELERAEPLYRRAVKVQEQALGPEDPGVAVTLNHLADLYSSIGDDERAEPLYRRALVIQEQAYGDDHPSVAITLADLAGLATRQGRVEEAERLYLRAQASTRQELKEQPGSRAAQRRLAAVRVGLGKLYRAAGAAERAAESWTRAADIMAPLTAGTEDVAALHTHALALLYLGRVDEAQPLVAKLLAKGWSDPEFAELCRENDLMAGAE